MEAMVTRLLEQEVAVRAVLSEDRKTSHLIPSWQDIDVLESISKALSSISKLTDFLSGENHATVLAIVPVLVNLKTKILLPKEEDTSLTKDIKKSVLDDLLRRYDSDDIQNLLSICNFLDPHFKLEYISNRADLKQKTMESAIQFINSR